MKTTVETISVRLDAGMKADAIREKLALAGLPEEAIALIMEDLGPLMRGGEVPYDVSAFPPSPEALKQRLRVVPKEEEPVAPELDIPLAKLMANYVDELEDIARQIRKGVLEIASTAQTVSTETGLEPGTTSKLGMAASALIGMEWAIVYEPRIRGLTQALTRNAVRILS